MSTAAAHSSTTESLVHELGAILDAILGPSDSVRKQAEQRLDELVAPASAASGGGGEALYGLALVGQGAAAYRPEVRTLALVLLRRLAFRAVAATAEGAAAGGETPFDRSPAHVLERTESCLLGTLEDETEPKIRKAAGEVVGRWAEESVKRGRPMARLPPLMLQLTNSASPLHRLSVYQLLTASPDMLFANPEPRVTPAHVAQVLAGGLADPVDDVKLASLRAVSSVLATSDRIDKRARQEIGPPLVAAAVNALAALPADMVASAAIALNPLAAAYPALFAVQLPTLLPLLEAMCLATRDQQATLPECLRPSSFTSIQPAPLTIGLDQNKSSPDLTSIDQERYAAAQELLLELLEGSKKSVVRKHANGAGGLEMIPVFLARMVLGIGSAANADDELESWLEQEDLDEDDEEYPVLPEEGLDRFAALYPAQLVCERLFGLVTQLAQQPDWRARHTALMSLAAVGESLQEHMSSFVPQIVTSMIVPLAADPHPRVRYAVCHALGQLSTDFEEVMQEPPVLESVLPVEIRLLDAKEHRVAAHAAAAIVNFVDGSEAPAIAPYLDEMVTKILALLQGRPIFVNEQALTTIACIAITAERDFARFYPTIMPLLLGLLRSPANKEHRMLKARGMECAGLLGMAVGKEVFGRDALELGELLAAIQTSITEDDDPQASYLPQTWAKIATALQTDFQPFMTHVMPSVLQKAALKPEIMRVDPLDPSSIADSAGWEILELEDDSQIGIKTSALEDKAASFEVMATYVTEVGADAFAPYLEPALRLCLDALSFLFDERVREAAATMIPPLLQIAKHVGNAAVAGEIFGKLNAALQSESDPAYLALLYSKFTESLAVMQAPLPADYRQAFDAATQHQLQTIGEARQARQTEQLDWDHTDRGIAAEEEEAETMALDEMAKAVHAVDEQHSLLVAIGSVRELGLQDGAWEDEEE